MDIPILMYHHIQPEETEHDLSVTPEAFGRHMAYLKQRGFETVSLHRLAEVIEHKDMSVLPKRPVVITFDDAFQSVYTHARPVMESCGFKATVFVVAEAMGRHNFWDDGKSIGKIKCMVQNELMVLRDQGWEIGSHGATHCNLTEQAEEALQTEVRGSRTVLEQILQTTVDTFCYPFGAWNTQVHRAVRAAGYVAACAISPGTGSVTENLWALRRVYVKASDSLGDFKRKVSPWYLKYRAWRKR